MKRVSSTKLNVEHKYKLFPFIIHMYLMSASKVLIEGCIKFVPRFQV